MMFRHSKKKSQSGQILILCALLLIVLLLFVGLAVDFGLAYVTKATLGKAVDAAAIAGARYVGKGQATATQFANNTFDMNYGQSSRDFNSPGSGGPPKAGTVPTPQVTFTNDPVLNVTLVTVTATTTINTYFLALVPGFKTLNVTASAQARYARVQMTLVIDRTGSMKQNAPGNTLPNAMIGFIDDFDNVYDTVALVSFANDQTIDVPMMTGGFLTPVTAAANAMPGRFAGGTFSDGGLKVAITEEQLNMGLSPNIIKAVVFFTDGQANTIQRTVTCQGNGHNNAVESGTWNIGGTDAPTTSVYFLSTSNTAYKSPICPGNNAIAYPLNINPSNTICASQNDNSTGVCNGKFTSSINGNQLSINTTNVRADALNDAILDSNTLRANNVIVYAIGLGADPQASYLCQIANDPCLTFGGNPSYNPNLPSGEYQPAANASQLAAAFQEIANNMHLRLLQ